MTLPLSLVRAIVAALRRQPIVIPKHVEDKMRTLSDRVKFEEEIAGTRSFRIAKMRTLSMAWALAIDEDAHARGICAQPPRTNSMLRTVMRVDRLFARLSNCRDEILAHIHNLNRIGVMHFGADSTTVFTLPSGLSNVRTLCFVSKPLGVMYHYTHLLWLLGVAPNLRSLTMAIYTDCYHASDVLISAIMEAAVASPHLRLLNLEWSILDIDTRAAFVQRFGKKVKF